MRNIDKIKESSLSELLDDGINDKNLFKAVIFAGGPGAEKSFIADEVMSDLRAKIVNPDQLFMLAEVNSSITSEPNAEANMARLYTVHKAIKDGGQKINPAIWFSDNLQNYRETRLKFLLKKGVAHWINGMLPLVIDSTGRDTNKIKEQKDFLTKLGYDVAMVFVNTTLEVALDRNRTRERVLPDDYVEKNWERIQANIGYFNSIFGSKYFYVADNNKPISNKPAYDALMKSLTRIGRKAFGGTLKNPIGNKIRDTLKLTGGKYYSDVFKDMEM